MPNVDKTLVARVQARLGCTRERAIYIVREGAKLDITLDDFHNAEGSVPSRDEILSDIADLASKKRDN